MKKALTKSGNDLYYYKDGERIEGKNDDMSGNCSGLYGDCTGLRSNCTDLRGDCSDLYGNCSDLYGNCTGLRGDLDDCEITDEERKKGVDIKDLIN